MKRQTYYIYSHSLDGQLLYIGLGTKPRLTSEWDRGRKWRDKIKKVSRVDMRILARFYNREKAARFEQALIEFCQPPCNTVYAPLRYRNRAKWANPYLSTQGYSPVLIYLSRKDRVVAEKVGRAKNISPSEIFRCGLKQHGLTIQNNKEAK